METRGPRTGALALVLLLVLAGLPAAAQPLTATEMVRRYDRLLRGETNQWQV
ncbi:MAG: hypothetical protein HYV62_08485, partial [Candidatus Rokubacteria bacterium]|nr:hypothetical protein [Candidatus Rokubacteria bacterium]